MFVAFVGDCFKTRSVGRSQDGVLKQPPGPPGANGRIGCALLFVVVLLLPAREGPAAEGIPDGAREGSDPGAAGRSAAGASVAAARQTLTDARGRALALREELLNLGAKASLERMLELRESIREQERLARRARSQLEAASATGGALGGTADPAAGSIDEDGGPPRIGGAASGGLHQGGFSFLQWLLIVAAVLFLWWAAARWRGPIARRLVRAGSSGCGEWAECTEVLGGILQVAARTLVVVGGIGFGLVGLGVPPGAVVLGLAAGVAACAWLGRDLLQNLASGVHLLREPPYGPRDMVQLGSVAGVVEAVTPRTTVLRDRRGALHHVPHREIKSVVNLTNAWSLAVVEVRVPYDDDIHLVLELLRGVVDQLRQDEAVGGLILEHSESVGLERFEEQSAVVKVVVKTRPVVRDEVERELRRRVHQLLPEREASSPASELEGRHDELPPESGK